MIIIRGTLIRIGDWHAVEAPALGLHTQGSTKTEALRMAVAWVRDFRDRQDLAAEATADAKGPGFTLRCDDDPVLMEMVIGYALGRLREGVELLQALWSAANWHQPIRDQLLSGKAADVAKGLNEIAKKFAESPLPSAGQTATQLSAFAARASTLAAHEHPARQAEMLTKEWAHLELEVRRSLARSNPGPWPHPIRMSASHAPMRSMSFTIASTKATGEGGKGRSIASLNADLAGSVEIQLHPASSEDFTEEQKREIGRLLGAQKRCKSPLADMDGDHFNFDFGEETWGKIATEVLIRDRAPKAIQGKVVIGCVEVPVSGKRSEPGSARQTIAKPRRRTERRPAGALLLMLKVLVSADRGHTQSWIADAATVQRKTAEHHFKSSADWRVRRYLVQDSDGFKLSPDGKKWAGKILTKWK